MRELLDLPAREFRPSSLLERNEDPYDLDELDDHDLERTHFGAVRVVASSRLDAAWLTEYPFLLEETQERFAEVLDTCERRLRERFGEPLAHPGTLLRTGDGEWAVAWEADGRRLVLQLFELVGDGDHELQIWLAVTDF
ncbi:hypothetical protein [Streptomyces manipurensis]|uniref:hypothetical protein n=1 Tax=Streptomyces manipurensis TaxID=1077945 RepID=UPI003C6F2DCE